MIKSKSSILIKLDKDRASIHRNNLDASSIKHWLLSYVPFSLSCCVRAYLTSGIFFQVNWAAPCSATSLTPSPTTCRNCRQRALPVWAKGAQERPRPPTRRPQALAADPGARGQSKWHEMKWQRKCFEEKYTYTIKALFYWQQGGN